MEVEVRASSGRSSEEEGVGAISRWLRELSSLFCPMSAQVVPFTVHEMIPNGVHTRPGLASRRGPHGNGCITSRFQ
jgi:hypothetical protein